MMPPDCSPALDFPGLWSISNLHVIGVFIPHCLLFCGTSLHVSYISYCRWFRFHVFYTSPVVLVLWINLMAPLVYSPTTPKAMNKSYLDCVLGELLSAIRMIDSLFELQSAPKEFSTPMIMVNCRVKGILHCKLIIEVLQSTFTMVLLCLCSIHYYCAWILFTKSVHGGGNCTLNYHLFWPVEVEATALAHPPAWDC